MKRALATLVLSGALVFVPAQADAGWTKDGWEVKGTNFTPLNGKHFRIKNRRDERVVYRVRTTTKDGWTETGTYRVPPKSTRVFKSWFRGKHRAVNSWWIPTGKKVKCIKGCGK